jgi:hypothetical protein
MYRALIDPQDALRQLDAGKKSLPLEGGNSLANTYHWIGTLGRLGLVQPSVTADCPLYAVFDQVRRRHYVAYGSEGTQAAVTFSDGSKLPCDDAGFHEASRFLE